MAPIRHGVRGSADSPLQPSLQGTSRRSTRPRIVWWLLVAGVVLSLIVTITGGLLVVHLRERALKDAERELSNLALVLANSFENIFRTVGHVQDDTADYIKTAEQFTTHLTTREVHDNLRARAAGLPEVEAIFLSDANGKSVASSRIWPLGDVSVAERDYFLGLRDDPTRTTFLGVPSRNKLTGTWNIYLSRRIDDADGHFIGIVVVALDLAYFDRFLSRVAPGPNSSVAVLRRDGIFLARHPQIDGIIGSSQADDQLFSQTLARAESGVIQTNNTVDGLDRVMAARTLTEYPVVVVASRTVAEILIIWRQQVYHTIGITLLFLFSILGMVAVGMRQIQSVLMLDEANSQLALAQERERTEKERRIQHGRLEVALDSMSQGLCMFDADKRVIVSNGRFASILGLQMDAASPGVHLNDLVNVAAQSSSPSMECGAELIKRTAAALYGSSPVSYVHALRDGRSLSVSLSPVASGGWLVTYEDVTEQRQAEARIAHLAHHDALTGLPNRTLFRIRLDEAACHAAHGEPTALFYLDLDHFKDVNDTLGHPIGDTLLQAVSQRLSAEIRRTDTIARIGGDEFAIVQAGVADSNDTIDLAKRLVDVLNAPFNLDGRAIVVGASIGIALAPDDGLDPDQLLKKADIALYRAKADGRGSYRFFEPEMDVQVQMRRALEIDLRQAVALGEFEIYYQPIVSIASGQVSGFEALLRWHHPLRGLVSPDRFVPLAEELGLIVPIGAWALSQACADAAAWPAAVKVAVNLSPVQFADRGLVSAIAAAVSTSGLDPTRLELEITETVMLTDTEATLATLHRLKALGVSIALDDFGTGYSSLSYLQRFPFDRVKIDRSFIRHLGETKESGAIVRAVTDLCISLGMAATAEGVETEQQLRLVTANHCTHAQGYLFSPPRPNDDVPNLLKTLAHPIVSGAESRAVRLR